MPRSLLEESRDEDRGTCSSSIMEARKGVRKWAPFISCEAGKVVVALEFNSAKWKSNMFCLTHATRKQSDKNSTSLYMIFLCTSFRGVNNSFFSSIFRSGLKGSPWIYWFKPRTAHKKVKLTWTIHRINSIPKNRSSNRKQQLKFTDKIPDPI